MILGVTRRDIACLTKGQTRSTHEPALLSEGRAASDEAIAESDKANKDLCALLSLLTDKLTSTSRGLT